jgi:hypothetical protein
LNALNKAKDLVLEKKRIKDLEWKLQQSLAYFQQVNEKRAELNTHGFKTMFVHVDFKRL